MPCQVLIVEDDILVGDALESMALESGYYVCGRVRSGAGALLTAKLRRPDIVFMDVKLVGKQDGIDAAAAIRKEVGSGIVFITAYTDEGTRLRMRREVPAAEVISKPIAWSDIKAACERIHSLRPRVRDAPRA